MDRDGNVVYPDDPAKQAEFVFESLQKILAQTGATLDDVVKATIFVTDMNDFKRISEVRNRYFKNSEPVSTLVEVKRDGLSINSGSLVWRLSQQKDS